jgi:hypothetical protein
MARVDTLSHQDGPIGTRQRASVLRLFGRTEGENYEEVGRVKLIELID